MGSVNFKEVLPKFCNTIPVDLEAIAQYCEIEVRRQYLISEISGMISMSISSDTSDKHFVITINKSHSDVRNRFTFAHELAHFFLHKDCIGDGITDDVLYRSSLSSDQEVEANKLAADILMPTNKIKEIATEYMKNHNLKSPLAYSQENSVRQLIIMIYNLAFKFNVSDQAMSIRLGLRHLI